MTEVSDVLTCLQNYSDTEGFTDRNIPRLPFKNVRRPLYPLDEIEGLPIDK